MATMKKKITPMIHAKTKFHDRAFSCGNHTFPPYDCPVILQRGGGGGVYIISSGKGVLLKLEGVDPGY